jgi:hypothetical protein
MSTESPKLVLFAALDVDANVFVGLGLVFFGTERNGDGVHQKSRSLQAVFQVMRWDNCIK